MMIMIIDNDDDDNVNDMREREDSSREIHILILSYFNKKFHYFKILPISMDF